MPAPWSADYIADHGFALRDIVDRPAIGDRRGTIAPARA